MNGRFITFEGIDGAGKSSHVAQLQAFLERHQIESVATREPGGTPLGEEIRALLIAREMDPRTEALLAFAARAEHLAQIIRPKLAAGVWVISDRFTEASYAYQGAGRGLGFDAVGILEQWCQNDLRPDLTFVFDLPPRTAKKRIEGGEFQINLFETSTRQVLDRFERQDEVFFVRVRAAYLQLANLYPERFCVLDAQQSPAVISALIAERISRLFKV